AAILCGVLCAAGLIASGSRGALVGSAAGFVACLLVAVPAGRFLGFGLAAVLVFVAATYSLTSLGLESQAVERLSATMDEPVLRDGRLDHWPDAVRAAVAYFPLGGGLGSYRYAHLPYQETTHGSWYANADNQWLEWWVEGGLVAISLIVAAVGVVGLAIRRLLTSADPLDRGMAAAGAYGLAAILVSQLFDFALLISPIAIAATLLLSAVVARAAMVGQVATKVPAVPLPASQTRKRRSEPSLAKSPSGSASQSDPSQLTPAQAANEARLAAATRRVTTLRPPSPSPLAARDTRLSQKTRSTPSPREGREERAGRATHEVEPRTQLDSADPPRALEPDPPGGRVMGTIGSLTEASANASSTPPATGPRKPDTGPRKPAPGPRKPAPG
ncbi:O-antigen ligase family protein, partial [Candidatus Laterigemmans baculatus]|uniref:O-antigen ligase family protein n=1 Tax=Candidatus Laterigemmans baculatus TaxID=2770505 RepID=UPI00193BB4F0